MFRKERTTIKQLESIIQSLSKQTRLNFVIDKSYGTYKIHIIRPDGGWSSHIAYGTKSDVYNQLKCALDIMYNVKNFT